MIETTYYLEDDGERMIPAFHKNKLLYGEHVGRYLSVIDTITGRVVLDIACGSGYGSQFMAGSAKKVYGVDIDEATVRYAKQHFSAKNLEYLVGSGTAIPLEDGAVEAVVSMETIEHIKDQEKFLSEVKRVLKPGGVFIVSTPNDKEYPKGNHFHVREHDKKSLEKLLGGYFKNLNFYYQTDELAATIISEKRLNSEFDSKSWRINKTTPLAADKCIYMLAACSDDKAPMLTENTMLAEFYSYHEVSARWKREQELAAGNEQLKKQLKSVEHERDTLSQELEALRNSTVVKAGKYVWAAKHQAGKLVGRGRPGDKK